MSTAEAVHTSLTLEREARGAALSHVARGLDHAIAAMQQSPHLLVAALGECVHVTESALAAALQPSPDHADLVERVARLEADTAALQVALFDSQCAAMVQERLPLCDPEPTDATREASPRGGAPPPTSRSVATSPAPTPDTDRRAAEAERRLRAASAQHFRDVCLYEAHHRAAVLDAECSSRALLVEAAAQSSVRVRLEMALRQSCLDVARVASVLHAGPVSDKPVPQIADAL